MYLYILTMALTTYLIRVLPLTLFRRPIRSRFLRSFLHYVPYCCLTAMTFPAILSSTESVLSGGFALVVGAATLAMMVFAPDIVAILATDAYAQAVWIIPPVAASVFFVFVYMQFANVQMYYGENRGITWISLAAAVANVVLNGVFIPRFGYLAAGWTTLASYVLLTLLHYARLKKICRKHRVSEGMFPEKLLLVLSIGMVLLAGLVLGLYTLGYVRYAAFAVEAILLVLFRKKLFGFLKSMK
jgi:O-antigen/teichoic acid export membrane protein